ncbi:MAG: DUF6036 family nucleotidyltransferase [Candidatus Hydrogenedentota bacterium]
MGNFTLTKSRILRLLKEISRRLGRRGLTGEIVLFGGAAMTVVFSSRESTRDVDAVFRPAKIIRDIAAQIGKERGMSETWLNDAVKGFVSDKGDHNLYYEDRNLKIFSASPEYILAMKCMSMRLADSKDEEDIKYLLKRLVLTRKEDVFALIEKYYPRNRIPAKTQFALEELFDKLK